jgi:hypothetical protein
MVQMAERPTRSKICDEFFVQIYAIESKRITQSFEGLCMQIALWSGMQVELDGSFVWANRDADGSWQVDGMIYDRRDAIEYVEIKGRCDLNAWWAICSAICDIDCRVDPKILSFELDRSIRVHSAQAGNWSTVTGFARNHWGQHDEVD